MDWTLIGIGTGVLLVVFLVGYFAGISRAKTKLINMLLKHKTILAKKDKSQDLEYGKQ